MGLQRRVRLCVVGLDLLREHVLRQREHDRPRSPGRCGRERPVEVLRHALGALDLRHPLRDPAEHGGVVDLLERLPAGHVPADLADEQDQRRRVLERGVHADRGVRRARAAGDDRDPRAAGELPVRVGHVRRARLVAADHVAQLGVAQRVEHGQVALAGDAEQQVGAVDAELVDEDLPAAAAHSGSSR